jgi:hypothetical protein
MKQFFLFITGCDKQKTTTEKEEADNEANNHIKLYITLAGKVKKKRQD